MNTMAGTSAHPVEPLPIIALLRPKPAPPSLRTRLRTHRDLPALVLATVGFDTGSMEEALRAGTPTRSQEFSWNQESPFDVWCRELNAQGWYLAASIPTRKDEMGNFIYTFIQLVPAHAHPDEVHTNETQTVDEGDGQS